MLRESGLQFATTATDVQCVVSLVREPGGDPCVEGIVVTPRVTGIQISHASGEPTTAPVLDQTADTHAPSLAANPPAQCHAAMEKRLRAVATRILAIRQARCTDHRSLIGSL